MAAATSATHSASASHNGGAGTRQCGSRAACHSTTARVAASSSPARFATQAHPVKMATNPIGTTRPISGTTSTFADRPETPTRWKYTTMGRTSPACTTAEITTSSADIEHDPRSCRHQEHRHPLGQPQGEVQGFGQQPHLHAEGGHARGQV